MKAVRSSPRGISSPQAVQFADVGKFFTSQMSLSAGGCGIWVFSSLPVEMPSYKLVVSGSRKLLAGCWIDDRTHLGDAVGGESAHLGVLAYCFFIRGDVDAVDLVVGSVALQPLDLWTQLAQDSTGCLRDSLQLFRC
jgi:hypothetical protein